jgi:hypothetical protein
MAAKGSKGVYYGDTPWNERTISHLKLWWEQGLTATEISIKFSEMEYSITRNAVIGKAHRMSFKQPPRGISPKAPRQRPRKRIILPPADPRAKVWSSKKTKLPTIIQTNILDMDNPGISIMELRDDTCHAIVRDGTFNALATYCGVKTEDKSSYCPAHAELFYQPPQERSRRR